MTYIIRNYIEELVKAFGLTKEEWEMLNTKAEEPTDKLYNQQNNLDMNEKGQS